jgi:hypothetical protein
MEVTACVGFCVWLRNITQVEMSALVHSCGRSANSLTTNFLVACSANVLQKHCRIVNNIHYLLCDFLDQTHGAQHCLDRRKL